MASFVCVVTMPKKSAASGKGNKAKPVTVQPEPLSPKDLSFIEAYLDCWNQTRAYMEAHPSASYDTARAESGKFLAKPNIKSEIEKRIKNRMSKEEILKRLEMHAKSDMDDFMTVDAGGNPQVDLSKAPTKRAAIKKIKETTRRDSDGEPVRTIEIELYDAQAALDKLAKASGLYDGNQKTKRELEKALDALESSLDSETYEKVLSVLAPIQNSLTGGDSD